MKKEYMMPMAEEIEVRLATMLCFSGDISDDDAEEPAHAIQLDELEDFYHQYTAQ